MSKPKAQRRKEEGQPVKPVDGQDAAELLKQKYGIDLKAAAGGIADGPPTSPRTLSFKVTMAASAEWRTKAELLFDEERYEEAAEAYSLAQRTAEASLQLLGNKQAPEDRTQAHDLLLDCMGSRGACHFRMRVYDRMYADIEAARRYEKRLEERPDVAKQLKHLLSPGNVRPDILRTPEAASRLQMLLEEAKAKARAKQSFAGLLQEAERAYDSGNDDESDSDDDKAAATAAVSKQQQQKGATKKGAAGKKQAAAAGAKAKHQASAAKPAAAALSAGTTSGTTRAAKLPAAAVASAPTDMAEPLPAAAPRVDTKRRSRDSVLETPLADMLRGGNAARRGVRWGYIGALVAVSAVLAAGLMAFEFALMQGIVDVGHLFGSGD